MDKILYWKREVVLSKLDTFDASVVSCKLRQTNKAHRAVSCGMFRLQMLRRKALVIPI